METRYGGKYNPISSQVFFMVTKIILQIWLLYHFSYFYFQEEYEDSSGNVVNKKTFEDLKRQGLL